MHCAAISCCTISPRSLMSKVGKLYLATAPLRLCASNRCIYANVLKVLQSAYFRVNDKAWSIHKSVKYVSWIVHTLYMSKHVLEITFYWTIYPKMDIFWQCVGTFGKPLCIWIKTSGIIHVFITQAVQEMKGFRLTNGNTNIT